MSSRKFDVFFSFRVGEAAPQARVLQALLHDHGVTSFACYEIEPGDSWVMRVADALKNSALMVVVATKNYAPSGEKVCRVCS